MYRAVTLAALRSAVDLGSDRSSAGSSPRSMVTLLAETVLLDGQDVTQAIRNVEVTRASRYAADSPAVRHRLTDWQREFARDQDVVTEGRDQGTLVFPDAFRKYYLTASEAERARRRVADYQARGERVSFEAVLRDQRQRDDRDAARRHRADEAGRGRDRHRLDGEEHRGRVIDMAADIERTSDISGRTRARGRDPTVMGHAIGARSPTVVTRTAPRSVRRGGTARYHGSSFTDFVRYLTGTLAVVFGWRATGQENMPESGGVLLVCNHLSFLDVFFLGIPMRRPLNYVAGSTLFIPVLGSLIRTVGAFPIQREGIGASGVKETLRRLRAGGIVTLSRRDTEPRRRARTAQAGDRGPGHPGRCARGPGRDRWDVRNLAAIAEVPIPHAIRIHFGPPISPDDWPAWRPRRSPR